MAYLRDVFSHSVDLLSEMLKWCGARQKKGNTYQHEFLEKDGYEVINRF